MRFSLRSAAAWLLALALAANAQYVSAVGRELLPRAPHGGTIAAATHRSASEFTAVAPRHAFQSRGDRHEPRVFVAPAATVVPAGPCAVTDSGFIVCAARRGIRVAIRGRAPPPALL